MSTPFKQSIEQVRQRVIEKYHAGILFEEFHVKRAAKTILMEDIPEDVITNYHLDAFAIEFFIQGHLKESWWIGLGALGFEEEITYPINLIFESV